MRKQLIVVCGGVLVNIFRFTVDREHLHVEGLAVDQKNTDFQEGRAALVKKVTLWGAAIVAPVGQT